MSTDSTPIRRRRFTQKAIDQYLEQFSASHLCASDFAASQGLCRATFSRWVRNSRSKLEPDSKTRFVEVTPPTSQPSKTEIRFPDGLAIHLHSTLGTDALSELIQRLRKS